MWFFKGLFHYAAMCFAFGCSYMFVTSNDMNVQSWCLFLILVVCGYLSIDDYLLAFKE